MQVNLSTFSTELGQAYRDILNASSNNNWALFSYDKATNDLRPVASGEGGLDELQDEFEGSKIQYAFCRVLDTNTKLPKFVFISWCGEGVPVSRKGLLSSHLPDVKNLLKGFHVEILARAEEDVRPAVIMKKVRDSTGSKYSHVQADLSVRKDIVETPASVPHEDSVLKIRREREEREKMLVEREKQAQKESSDSSTSTTNTAQQVRQEREQREKELVEREKAIEKARAEPKAALPTPAHKTSSQVKPVTQVPTVKPTIKSPPPTMPAPKPPVAETRQPSTFDFIRQQNSVASDASIGTVEKESDDKSIVVAPVVGEQAKNARNMWAQREKASETVTSLSPKVGKRVGPSFGSAAAQKPSTSDLEKEQRNLQEQSLKAQREQEEFERRKLQEAQEQAKRIQQEEDRIQQQVENEERERRQREEKDILKHQEEQRIRQQRESQLRHQQEERDMKEQEELEQREKEQQERLEAERQLAAQMETVQIQQGSAASSTTARALYDYEATDATEMTLSENEIIANIVKVDEGWWQGAVLDDAGNVLKQGLFPSNYVELLEAAEAPSQVAEPVLIAEAVSVNLSGSQHISAIVLFDYEATEENEMSLTEGELVQDIIMVDGGWWQGIVYDASGNALKTGLFPANYVQASS